MDSLSEDWISQPRSDESPDVSLPALQNSTSAASSVRGTSSRMPAPISRKPSTQGDNDYSILPLSERSPNNNNIPLSQRGSRRPSKLRNELSPTANARPCRTVSASSAQSDFRSTVQHKSVVNSPQRTKNPQETPEWKRRLLHGDVAYGEQKDLFSPAGLETIFRPPPTSKQSPSKAQEGHFESEDMAMPSSPPLYTRKIPLEGQLLKDVDVAGDEHKMTSKPKMITYKLADTSGNAFSEADLTQSSSFRPQLSVQQAGSQAPESTTSSSILQDDDSVIQHPRDCNHSQLAGRVPSGQSDIRHEDLSPIFLSRHNTVDGRVDYAALDISATELEERLGAISAGGQDRSCRTGEETQIPEFQEDATADTEDFAHNGNFINVRRGGHSNEGSFQRRMLSPSSLPPIDESAMLQEESIEASTPKELPKLPIIRKTRTSDEQKRLDKQDLLSVPSTPQLSPIKEERPKFKSGSPLKLFGTYDTFTNQTLLRRLSQFENSMPDEDSNSSFQDTRRGESASNTEMNVAYLGPSSPSKDAATAPLMGTVNAFGDGILDQYQFSEQLPTQSWKRAEGYLQNEFDQDPSNNSGQGIFKANYGFSSQKSMASRPRTRASTLKSTESMNSKKGSWKSPDLSALINQDLLKTPRKLNGDVEGKRLPKSPLKDPTPKRRRTLHKSDISHLGSDDHQLDSVIESHQNIQSVIGKMRKDAIYDNNHQPANPQILAARQILKPRTPTPSRHGSGDYGAQRNGLGRPLPLSEMEILEQQQKIAKIQAELDAVQYPRTNNPEESEHLVIDGNRKASVTTQDFLDEAKKIMAGIRGKAKPHSGLNSVEESETDVGNNDAPKTSQNQDEDSYQESTQEPFSRPPSREGGGPVPRQPQKQEDPELLSHLKKYEEIDDFGDVVASSTRSIELANKIGNSIDNTGRVVHGATTASSNGILNDELPYESDPPNIQITEYPELQRKRKHSTSSVPIASDEAGFQSQGSNASSQHSTGNTIPTGSSRGSDSKRIIAPETIAHLIPQQLAGMVFDHDKKAWVKRKGSEGLLDGQNVPSSDDDDPFGDIPDLTVDETAEMQRIKSVAARKREETRLSEVQHYQRSTLDQVTNATVQSPPNSDESSPPSEPSRAGEFTSSVHLPETRATSWSDEHLSVKTEHVVVSHRTVHNTPPIEMVESQREGTADDDQDVEQEISINESRGQPERENKPRRNVTISFSSPLTSIIQSHAYDDSDEKQEDESDMAEGLFDRMQERSNDEMFDRQHRQRAVSASKSRTSGVTSRRISLAGQDFITRPVSRIDEHDEESFSEHLSNDQMRSVSVVISTPLSARNRQISAYQPSATVSRVANDSLYQLSPLSEFTVNHAEESFAFEVSYIEPPIHRQVGTGGRRSLSLTVKELVQRITDVEPYEPFWEHIKQLNLKKKKLRSLHMLSKFCGQVEELDVSENEIEQLDGAPESIRQLWIIGNSLTDITAWHHLRNLQYLDISNNEMTTLEGLKDLVHLRALRADNNKIQSLKAILHLDGLISLRLRNNLVETVEFSGSKLQRLTELDLKGNKVHIIHGCHELRSLTTLNLEDNDLSSFETEITEIFWTLKYLKLSGNNLAEIDVSRYPNLRLLYVDRNRLGKIIGLLKTKHLDSLSMREQQDGSILDLAFLSTAFEIRKLFLSGNLLAGFEPQVDFLNLQYLELANCGLDSLPANFGQLLANIRVLNLNSNALRDIKPLLGIVRLKKLHLAGNRLNRLRKTANVLGMFPSLSRVDLRSNPLTLGFYTLGTERRIVVHSRSDGNDDEEAQACNPFEAEDQDEGKDASYAGRLDMETRMRRRVYEMLILGGCARLRVLDGLGVEREWQDVRDAVWEELVKAELVQGGLAQLSPPGVVEQHGQVDGALAVGKTEMEFVNENGGEEVVKPEDIAVEEPEPEVEEEKREETWPAEDSFA
jgi:Leucine-rich repeat (LRR) protein